MIPVLLRTINGRFRFILKTLPYISAITEQIRLSNPGIIGLFAIILNR
jgi:hypothetical protein